MARPPGSPRATPRTTPRSGSTSGGGLALAVEVARRFHLLGDSKVSIAADLGISRFKVARLLDAARAAGMVQIHIGAPPQVDAGLSEALSARFGLRQAVVLAPGAGAPPGAEDTEGTEAGALGRAVGRLASDYVQQLVSADDVVGLAWGHAMSAMADGWTEHVPATFVQLAGAVARPDMAQNAPDLVRATAAAAGGSAVFYYAPLVMPDAGSARALRAQVGVHDALAHLDGLSKAVISIGAWAPGESTVHDSLEARDRGAVTDAGVVAETTGLLVTPDGEVVDVLADRTVAVSEAQLRRTAHVIALAVGTSRSAAVAAVARSGLISTLVTHTALARALLAG